MIHTCLPPTRRQANNPESVVSLSRNQLQAGLPRGPGEQRRPPTHGKIPHPLSGDNYLGKPTSRKDYWRPQLPLNIASASHDAEEVGGTHPGSLRKIARAFSL